MTVLRVALAQLNPTVGDLDGNLARSSDAYDRADAAGCDLVAFPELSDHRVPAGGPPASSPASSPTTRTPSPSSPPAPATASPSSGSSTPTATCSTPPPCAPVARCSAPTASACCRTTPCSTRPATSRRATRPIRWSCTSIGGVKVGISICEDVWSPDGPLAVQADGGAELAVNINASPYHRGKAAARERMLATRAADCHSALVYVNQVGGQDELVFDGCSLVFDAEGRLLARGPQFREDLLDRRRARRRPSTASACSTRVAGCRRCRCPTSLVTEAPDRPRRSGRQPRRRAAVAGGRAVRGARARHPRLLRARTGSPTSSSGCPAASTRRSWP